jgi:hypothetical protein
LMYPSNRKSMVRAGAPDEPQAISRTD